MALKKHKNKINTMSLLNPRRKVFAGLLSMLISASGAIALGLHLYTGYKNLPANVVLLESMWIVAMISVACAGIGLLKSNKSAMWTLLGFWLIIAVGSVLQGFAWMLWGPPSLLGQTLEGFTAVGTLVGLLVLSSMIVAALVWATPRGSRNRYGMLVGASIAAGVALIFAINMIAAAYPYQKDIEQFKRFGLSEKTKGILDKVENPMQISAVYTAAASQPNTAKQRDDRVKTRDRLERVMELLEAVNQYNPQIQVADASGNVERMKLMERIRKRQLRGAEKQIRLLEKIQHELPAIYKQLDAVKLQWESLPKNSYLLQWDTQNQMRELVDQTSKKLIATDNKIRQLIASDALPDHVNLLKVMVEQLKETKNKLAAFSRKIERISRLPAKIKTNSPKAVEALNECVAAFNEMSGVVGKPREFLPVKPGATLRKLIAAFRKASQKTLLVSSTLSSIAGASTEFFDLVTTSKTWIIVVSTTPTNKTKILRNRYFSIVAKELQTLRKTAALKLSDSNENAQKDYLLSMRKTTTAFAELIRASQIDTEKAIVRLQTVDENSQEIFNLAKTDKLFADVLRLIDPLITDADKLKSPQNIELSQELSSDNIIVIEYGGRVEALSFDTVWPLVVRRTSISKSDDEPKRFFNGSAAISSRILKLTHKKPFARILITSAMPPIPSGMNPNTFPMQWAIVPGQLQMLYRQLLDANFLVGAWNLNEPFPELDSDKDSVGEELQTILLILPTGYSRIQIPGLDKNKQDDLNKKYRDKIRKVIDSGAAAIFMGAWLEPRNYGNNILIPRNYVFNPYLDKDWGIDVKTRYRMLEGIPQDGKFAISIKRFNYMLINNFPNNPPIGRGLRGRRLLWANVCPITWKQQLPVGVKILPLLTIPDNMTNIWATPNLQELINEMSQDNGIVTPHYDIGDMNTPLTVAIGATRSGNGTKKPSRIVVLGIGGGFADNYLTTPVNVAGESFRTEPPPRSNPAVVVNSAYWLIGRDGYIASSPGGTKPVAEMSKTMRSWIWAICVIAMPLGVLGVGGVVMLVRKR
jgi:hypothetical protein